jgi:predicted nucleic acid-binding protein
VLVVTSSISSAEVIKVKDLEKCDPGRVVEEEDEAKIEADLAKIKDYLENPWITRRVVDAVIAERAGNLRRRFKLKLPDAIHLATAWHYEVDQLQTYDPHLLRLTGLVTLDKKGTNLKICHPELPPSERSLSQEQMSMFEGPGPDE